LPATRADDPCGAIEISPIEGTRLPSVRQIRPTTPCVRVHVTSTVPTVSEIPAAAACGSEQPPEIVFSRIDGAQVPLLQEVWQSLFVMQGMSSKQPSAVWGESTTSKVAPVASLLA
jgi:hypothetical protein